MSEPGMTDLEATITFDAIVFDDVDEVAASGEE